MIELKNISKKFNEQLVLDNINLTLPNTGLVLIKGQNGSGKTTLVNLISTLDTPSLGNIIIDNTNVFEKTEKELCKFREENISIIFQKNNLIENMTVEENINITGTSEKFQEIIDMLTLNTLLKKRAKSLSGGEQQRVAIARAILKNTKIIIADEPTSSLDVETKKIILDVLKKLSANRLVILIAHESEYINDYADKIIEISNGSIISINDKIRPRQQESQETKVSKYKNKYNYTKFAISSILSNTKVFARNMILIVFSLLFVFITVSISSINYKKLHADSMILEKKDIFILDKQDRNNEGQDDFNNDDLEYIKNETNQDLIYGYNIRNFEISNDRGFKFNIDKKINQTTTINYMNLTYLNEKELNNVDFGTKPTIDSEIVISTYIADLIIKYGIMLKDNSYYQPTSYDDVINDRKEIKLSSESVYISGIYKINYTQNDSTKYNNTIYELAKNVYVSDEFFNKYKEAKPIINQNTYHFSIQSDEEVKKTGSYNSIHELEVFNQKVTLTDGTSNENLNPGEVIVGFNHLEIFKLNINEYLDKEITFYIRSDDINLPSKKITLKVVGLSLDGQIYFHNDDVKDYLYDNLYIDKVLIKTNEKNEINNIIKIFPQEKNGIEYRIITDYSTSIDDVKRSLSVSVAILKFISTGLILLTAVAIYTYILNIINNQKNEIALLKSLGISNKEISKSLFYEELILIIVSYVLSIIFFIISRIIINNLVSNYYKFKLNIIPTNIVMLIIVFLTSIMLVYLINLITFNKIEKTKPEILFKKAGI